MKDTKIQRYKDIKGVISGFTLIELLVVISIIGVLISVAASRYVVAERQARDTRRKSDLNQYRVALENFAVNNGTLYPASESAGVYADTLCSSGCSEILKPYMSECLIDSRAIAPDYNFRYVFVSNSTFSCGSTATINLATKYLLYIKSGLESNTASTWVVCWDGRSGLATKDNWVAILAFCPIY